jgi:hypothetical protein
MPPTFTSAALRVLADVSHATQIVLFTHRAHLVDLAAGCVGEDILFPHRLGCDVK